MSDYGVVYIYVTSENYSQMNQLQPFDHLISELSA